MKKCGRPKKIPQTVIGFPKRQARKTTCIPFDQKASEETILITSIQWLMGKEKAKSAVDDV